MKKSILILAVIMTATLYVSAQDKNVGVGLAYGTDVEQPALFVNGQYFFNEKLAVAPSLIFYLPDTQKSTVFGTTYSTKVSYWEFNADVNYYFVDSDVRFYGLAGLNVTGYKVKIEQGSTKSSSSDTQAGLNIGIGLDFKAGDKVIPFVQAKYTLGDADQLVLMGGVRFPIGK